jgi:hypothetical protein
VEVALRTVHICAMALVLGGLSLGAGFERLRVSILLTLLSGALLFLMDLTKAPGFLVQGSGVAVLLKLALLGVGNLLPGDRFQWYMAATAVASVGSHMPGAWRHFSFREWRVLGHGKE